jgi:hypothetical protein
MAVAACRMWYYLNDPAAIPPGGIPDELCSRDEVDKLYAAMTSILAVADGVGSLCTFSSKEHELTFLL